MDILKRNIILLATSVSLTGCYTDFEPDIHQPEMLCMNSLICAEEPVIVELTHTWNYPSGPAYNIDTRVPGSDIELWINGSLKEKLSLITSVEDEPDNNTSGTRFISTYTPHEGDEVRLFATSDRYGNAEATIKVPVAVVPDKIVWSADPGNTSRYDYQMSCNPTISAEVYFTDPAESDNYYMVDYNVNNPEPYAGTIGNITWLDCGGKLSIWSLNYDVEPLFSEHISVLESVMGSDAFGYSIFSDRSISGRNYPLHILLERGYYYCLNPLDEDRVFDTTIDINLYSITESYYNWFISQWKLDDSFTGSLSNTGLSEAFFCKSNVSSGAGIVAAYNYSTATINLHDFLQDLYNSLNNPDDNNPGLEDDTIFTH